MPSHLVSKVPRIVIFVHTTFKTNRDFLKGIVRYLQIHGPWGVHLIEGRPTEQKFNHFSKKDVDGVIGLMNNSDRTESLVKANIPAVILLTNEKEVVTPKSLAHKSFVSCDSAAIGNFAADYFLNLKFPHYGFVGEIFGKEWSVVRGNAYADKLKLAGFDCHFYHSPLEEAASSELDQINLCQWLKSLPKPIALFAAMDRRGREVINACNLVGIKVPHEVAVLGVDNDELICDLTTPALSSILLDIEEVGFNGMKLLDQLMKRNVRKSVMLKYGPKEVISRRSTDPIQCSDEYVSKVLEYIWINVGKPISVSEIVRMIGISRRSLEVRFFQNTGHTILQEIHRVQLNRVCTLLLTTDLTINEITELSGFAECSYLGKIFRDKYHLSMSEFRQKHTKLRN